MNVDYEKTKSYYKELKKEDLYDCDYYKIFRLYIKLTYPEFDLY